MATIRNERREDYERKDSLHGKSGAPRSEQDSAIASCHSATTGRKAIRASFVSVFSARQRLLLCVLDIFVFTAFLSLTGCVPLISTTTPPLPQSTRPITYQDLEQRSLHIPMLPAGASCVTTKGRQVTSNYGIALGSGPVYPVGLSTDGVLDYYPPTSATGDWGGQKVLWVVSPDYHGLVLIRGRQLDGSDEVRFDVGDQPVKEPPAMLEFDALGLDPGGWTGQPSHTYIRKAGCYAYQVDGDNFSKVIIFQAVPKR